MTETKERRRAGARPPRALRPAEIGLIKVGRLGGEKTSARGATFRLPEKLDYFLLCRSVRGQDGNFVVDDEAMRLHVPDWKPGAAGPKRIPIVLFSHEPTENAYYEWAYYDGRSRRCYNNTRPGEEPATWIDEKGEEIERACPCELREKGACKDHSVLRCALFKAPRVGGAWIFRTTAKASADALFNSMDEIRAVTGGYLAGLPLELVVYKRTVEREGKQFGVPMVNIEYPGSLDTLLAVARELARNRLEAGRELRALSAGEREEDDDEGIAPVAQAVAHEPPEEQEAFAAEFYPSEEAQAAQEERGGDGFAQPEEPLHWWLTAEPEQAARLHELREALGIPLARWQLEVTRFASFEECEAWLIDELHELRGDSPGPEARNQQASEAEQESPPVADDGDGQTVPPAASPEGEGPDGATAAVALAQSPSAGPAPAPDPFDRPPSEITMEDYLRLETLDGVMATAKLGLGELPAYGDLSKEQFNESIRRLRQGWAGLSQQRAQTLRREFLRRCERLGIGPNFGEVNRDEATSVVGAGGGE